MLKTILTTIGVMLLVAYLAVAGFVYHAGRHAPMCRDVVVVVTDSDETQFIHAADIGKMLAEARIAPRGKKMADINTLQITRIVESNPIVRRAYCYHTPDSIVRIDVEQRRPIMRVKSAADGDFCIDSDGDVMPVPTGIALHLPLTTGHVRRSAVRSSGLYELAQFLQDDRFWRSEVTQVYVAPTGDVTLVPRVGNHTIMLGSLDGFEEKLSRVRTFYNKVMPRKGWNAYRRLNAAFDGQVIGEK